MNDNKELKSGETAFLTSVHGEIQAELIEADLKANGIPVLKKFKEAGAYLDIYMGMTSFGIDLYVPSNLLDDAKNILKDFENSSKIDEEEKELIEANKEYIKKRNRRIWILLLFFLPSLLIGIILYIIYM